MITCKKCGESKPDTDYSYQDSTYKIRRKKCKKCHAAEMRETNYGRIVQKKSNFSFDPLLDYFLAIHARPAKRPNQARTLQGSTVIATSACEDNEYMIEEYNVVTRIVRPMFGHPTGVQYA